jgi:Icc protein
MEPVYFVHISDTHLGPTEAYSRHGYRPLPHARHIVEIINTLATRPDFVIHTGDVVTSPSDQAYQLAAGIFADLRIPIYYVTGNHDRACDIRRYLPMGPKEDCLPDPCVLCYVFEVKGYRFLVLDARGPDEIDPHGLLSEAQMEIVRQEATPHGPPLTIFIHYPLLRMNSPWMDANMQVLNGEELHRALLPARERLRGVFHGHVHMPMQIVRDGILYVSTASTFAQFTAWPDEVEVQTDHEAPPGYGFVHLLPEQTIIHQQAYTRRIGRVAADTWE